jgi:hypothetical protein
MIEKRENIILLAGNGQNVGKTLLACQIINNLKNEHEIIAIKICPHFHHLEPKTQYLLNNDNFQITKENNPQGKKDSNRLLNAGAKEVYYIQTKDCNLPKVMKYLDSLISPVSPILIESGGLRNVIEPGLFLMIENLKNKEIKPNTLKYRNLADLNIEFNGEKFNIDPDKIDFSDKKWVLKI